MERRKGENMTFDELKIKIENKSLELNEVNINTPSIISQKIAVEKN
jgi:hypothetical protein